MKTNSLTLGLDLGVTSIGWGLVDFENQAIVEAGVHTHDAPMELAKYEAGRPGSSNAVKRRQSIHQGRQLARRKARHRDLYISLQERGLLPYAGKKAEQRHLQLTELDRKLTNEWLPRIKTEAPDIPDPGQVVLYYLRHIALTSKLSEFELGRALYHLGQRRGFKSNRRESRATDAASENKSAEAETSEIKSSIKTLQSELGTSGLTLGSYLSHVNPHTTALRNRKRADIKPIWVGRAMFEEEFDRIWTAQSSYYPSILTPDFKRQVERLLFWQRKVSAGKPGRCALEENEIRAPRSSLLAQHFRLLQTLNNIKLRETSLSPQRRLARTERDLLLSALSKAIHVAKGSKQKESYGLTFTELKKHLGLQQRTAKVNLEDGDESTFLLGNRTNAIMSCAFGPERWNAMDERQQRRIVRKWITEQSPKRLKDIAREQWGLNEASAEKLASLEPEDGYAALSHKAMLRLLPFMTDEMLTYPEALERAGYTNRTSGKKALDYLPPVDTALPQIPNPVVKRTLSELRAVLNELIRKHGKPLQIRIELARDLKRNAEQRKRLQGEQKNNAMERVAARAMLERIGERVTESSLQKMLLYRRTKDAKCIYCGEPLGSPEAIFQPDSGIQVEHILPKRAHDNSMANKVLAHFSCNQRKGDRTPRQAFGETPQWDEMLTRVAALNNEALKDRFEITDEDLESFSARHLADTRYISKLAAEYVEVLYGGRDSLLPWEDRGRRCVFASSGSVTANLRSRWGLNALLKDIYGKGKNEKVRSDHRHHAIDAIVIALTSEATLQQITRDIQQHDTASGYTQPRYFSPPWPNLGEIEDRIKAFRSEVDAVIQHIKVSQRVNHKLNGMLHDANEYSPIVAGEKFAFHRVPVHTLKWKDVADPNNRVSRAVLNAIDRQCATLALDREKPLSKLEQNPAYIEKNGHKIVIRKIRRAVAASSLISLDRRPGTPAVEAGENHHFVLFKHLNAKGEEEWYTSGPVTRLEAMRRKDQSKRNGDKSFKVIDENDGPRSTFLMYLMKGDAVEMDDPVRDGRDIYILQSMSEGDFSFHCHNLATPSAKELGLNLGQLRALMQSNGDRLRIRNVDKLRELHCRKVILDPLGKVIYLRHHD